MSVTHYVFTDIQTNDDEKGKPKLVFDEDIPKCLHGLSLLTLSQLITSSLRVHSRKGNLLTPSSPGLIDQYNKGIIPTMVNELNSHQPVRFMSWRRRTETDMDGTNVRR